MGSDLETMESHTDYATNMLHYQIFLSLLTKKMIQEEWIKERF